MKTYLLPLLVFLLLQANAQTTLQEKLGYRKEDKLLIIHADDLGVSHSENAASIEVLEHGAARSASIMVPCPWFPEIAAYAASHPAGDFGLHLTLTSEWKYYKWPPVAAREAVSHLVNQYGFLYASVDSVVRLGNRDEVEKELRAQIERARQFGVDITHFDSHMGTLYAKDDYLQTVLKLGREYKVPVMLNKLILLGNRDTASAKDVVIDSIYVESPDDYKKGTEAYYTHILQTLQPGVNLIILHAAYDDKEMQAVSLSHPDYGAAWRQADVNFFTGSKCRQLLKDNNIKVITWRNIRDKVVRQ